LCHFSGQASEQVSHAFASAKTSGSSAGGQMKPLRGIGIHFFAKFVREDGHCPVLKKKMIINVQSLKKNKH
jgi:hypothetical protein